MTKPTSSNNYVAFREETPMHIPIVNDPSYYFVKFPNTKGCSMIKADTIIYMKAESNYTYVYFEDGRSQLYSKTLKYLTSLLPLEQFIRIHHSYVVNKSYICSITKQSITLEADINLPISRRLKKTIKL